jgi:hypothetical protein
LSTSDKIYYGQDKYERCNLILFSNYTNDTKKQEIASLYNYDPLFFNHDVIKNFNSKIELSGIPDDVQVYNSNYIKNATYNIFDITPSVLDKNSYYITNKGKITTYYSYAIELPKNYIASTYPDKSNGKCRQDFKITKQDITETIDFNNDRIYENKNNNINSNTNIRNDINYETQIEKSSYINAVLKINLEFTITNYEWECSLWINGTCKKWECKLDGDEAHSDFLLLTDNRNTTIRTINKNIKVDYGIKYGRGVAILEFSDLSSYNNIFIDGYYGKRNKISNTLYHYTPYDFLYLTAQDYERLEFQAPFVYVEGNLIYIPVSENSKGINVKLNDYFDNASFFINFTNFKSVKPIIKLNKMFYGDNDIIEVTPYLLTQNGYWADDKITIRYLNENKTTTSGVPVEFNFNGVGYVELIYSGDYSSGTIIFPVYDRQLVKEAPFLFQLIFSRIGLILALILIGICVKMYFSKISKFLKKLF